jgi:alpha-tubulin suppressor-like RCC1 family protein
MQRRFAPTICTTLALLAILFGAGPRPAAAQTAPAGDAWAWGNNDYGQVGDGSTTNRIVLVPVSTLTNVTAIAGGAFHSLALRSDGTVWAWGSNGSGQLGDGSTTERTTPVQVSTLTNVTAIA